MNLIDQYIKKFREIKNKGWIRSYRIGDTGVGYTLEKLLDQSKEEKKQLRIKSIRKGSSRRLTLFAKIPVWGAEGRKRLLDEYGYFDKNGRWSLYTSITSKKQTKMGWQIEVDDNKVFLNNSGRAVIYWQLPTLQEILQKKLNQMVLVYANFKKDDQKNEYFKYEEFHLAQEPDLNNFTNLINNGSICIDLAIHRDKITNSVIDKGFLFRISESSVNELFKQVQRIVE